MKNLLGVLGLVGMGIVVSCSSDSNTFDSSASGGAATGGASSVGGKTGAGGTKVNATEVPEKDWDSAGGEGGEGGATDGSDPGADDPFGDLLAHPYLDPNDPCALATPWVTGVDTKIEDGDLVQYLGVVYEYDTSSSSCNEQITHMFEQCIPSDPADWCKACWILQDLTCP